MSTLRLLLALALLLANAHGIAAAQSSSTLDDLKVRAEAGDKTATRQLADRYYLGKDGAAQDFKQAARWYLALAKQGDARAQTSIGLMYARGYGVAKNLAEAHRWWNFAAAQNDPGAQYNLGLTYVQGEGVAADYQRAARWFTEAARRGHVQAQHNLGMLHHEGKGVPQDAVRAYFRVRVAALQGDSVAADTLSQISTGMSAAQIAEAEARAREWMASAKKTLN